MSTRTLVRMIVATATLALLTVLLSNGPITYAGKADRTAPTTPTNLVVTAITERTVTLKWNASTDNSGKFSYRVKVNIPNSSYSTLEWVGQTETTYSEWQSTDAAHQRGSSAGWLHFSDHSTLNARH